MSNLNPELVEKAARAIAQADGILIGAGAGMGVDSGLPDFRGDEGFWNAYPPYRHLNCSFVEMANPHWFERDIHFAWGFYGHRRNLYRDTQPHQGFSLLLKWAQQRPHGGFVYTSNVDTQFQRAGFAEEQVVECHGTIEWCQCLEGCGAPIFEAGPETVEIDEQTMRAKDPLPSCPQCGGHVRPNILMFGDWGWEGGREAKQASGLDRWLGEIESGRLVVIECGAGLAVPTVRWFSERQVRDGHTLIRINPRDPEVPEGQVGLKAGALEALKAIDSLL